MGVGVEGVCMGVGVGLVCGYIRVTKLSTRGPCTQMRGKLAALETSSRAKEVECLQLGRQLEAARASEARLESRHVAAEEAAQKAEAELGAARQRAAQVGRSQEWM